MTIQGKLFKKFDTKVISDKFKKREFVLEIAENPMYPQTCIFQFTQDKVDLLEPFTEGQMIEVDFNLRGREWISPSGEIRFFNSLDAWRMKALSEAVQEPVAVPSAPDELDL